MSNSSPDSDEQSDEAGKSRAPKPEIITLHRQMTREVLFAKQDPNDDRFHFTIMTFFITACSIITYLLDIGSDCYLAVLYCIDHHHWYSALTAIFILLPLIAISLDRSFYGCFGLLDYVHCDSPLIAILLKSLVFSLIVLPLSLAVTLCIPLICYAKVMQDGHRQRRYWATGDDHRNQYARHTKHYISAQADAARYRLYESLLEAVPQLTLQSYILLVNSEIPDFGTGSQKLVMGFSFLSLSWALVAYIKHWRLDTGAKITSWWTATILYFGYSSMISARILSLALFATEFRYIVVPFFLFHWALMGVWISWLTIERDENRRDWSLSSVFEFLAMSAMYTVLFFFTKKCRFLNINDDYYYGDYDVYDEERKPEVLKEMRMLYGSYYAINFASTLILMAVWYGACDPDKWYRMPGILAVFGCLLIGSFFLTLYYKKYHPARL